MRFRVDVTSEPKRASDDALAAIRNATADLKDIGVQRGEEDVVVVSFEVEASVLGDAVTRGQRELAQRLEAAGIELPFLAAGATAWAN